MTSYVTREQYDALVARLDQIEQRMTPPTSVHVNLGEMIVTADALARGRAVLDMIRPQVRAKGIGR